MEIAPLSTAPPATAAVDYIAASSDTTGNEAAVADELLRDWTARGGIEGKWLTTGQPISESINDIDPALLTESLYYDQEQNMSLRAEGEQ